MDEEDYEELCIRYLRESWLYYQKDVSVVSDNMYDTMCFLLKRDYKKLPNWFKDRVSEDSLGAGTGFDISLTEEEEQEALDYLAKHGEWTLTV